MRKRILRIAYACLALALLPLALLLAAPARALAADSVPFIVTGTYQQSSARSMLQSINSWRANTADNWYLNPSGQRVYPGRLAGLTYDYELEQIAMQRAAEISLNFDHTPRRLELLRGPQLRREHRLWPQLLHGSGHDFHALAGDRPGL